MAGGTGEPLIMNETIFNGLKKFGWSQIPKNRHVMLVFDAVPVKDVLPTRNKPEGMPTHVLVFTIKVISGKRLQPIGNVFFNEDTPPWKVSKCIEDYVNDLEKCELFVVATICPPTEYLRSVVENLIEMRNLQNKTDAHIYSVGNINNVVHIYDAPSMLREVRNHFIKSPVTFKQFNKQYVGNYKDVEETLERNINESLRVILEMKDDDDDVNEYAIKLFSMSMSRELQGPNYNNETNTSLGKTAGTSNLCSFFDVLFDSFNGTANYDNMNRRSLSYSSLHNKIWRDAIPVLKSMHFLVEEKQKSHVSCDNVIDAADVKRKGKISKSSDSKKIQEENSNGDGLNEEISLVKPGIAKKYIDGSNLNENVSLCVEQKKQKKNTSTVQHIEAPIYNVRKQNEEKKKKDKQVKTPDRHVQVENTSPRFKQNKQKKIQATNQHIQPQNFDDDNLNEKDPSHVKRDEAGEHGDDNNFNKNISPYVKQGEQKKKTKAVDEDIANIPTNQLVQAEIFGDRNENENISSHVRQGKQKTKRYIEPENSDGDNLNEDTSSYIKQKNKQRDTKTAADESDFCFKQDKRRMQIKSTNRHVTFDNCDLHKNISTQMETKINDRAKNSNDDEIREKYSPTFPRSINRKNNLIRSLIEKFNDEVGGADGIVAEHNYASSMLESLNNTQYLDMVLENIDEDINDESLMCDCSEGSPSEMIQDISDDAHENYRRNVMPALEQSQNNNVNSEVDGSSEISNQLLSDAIIIYRAITNCNSHIKEDESKDNFINVLKDVEVNESSSFEESKTPLVSSGVVRETNQTGNKKHLNNNADLNESKNNNAIIKEFHTNATDSVSDRDLLDEVSRNNNLNGNFQQINRDVHCEINTSSRKTVQDVKSEGKNEESAISSKEEEERNDKKQEKQNQIDNPVLTLQDLKSKMKILNGKRRREIIPHPDNVMGSSNLPKIVFEVAEQLQQGGMWDWSCCTDNNKDAETPKDSTDSDITNQNKKLTPDKRKFIGNKTNEGTRPRPKSNGKQRTRKKACKSSDDALKEGHSCLSSSLAGMNLEEINHHEQYIDVREEVGDAVENANGLLHGDESDEFKKMRPYVLDAWIISINGMKEIYKNLQRKLFNSIDTKEFNVDCVKYMLHVVRKANGIDRPCPIENVSYQFLDRNLVEYAFQSEASITLK